jgi:hypothetical protein
MGVRCRRTMFTKQVSCPMNKSRSPIVAAEGERVERTHRKTCSRAESEFLCPSRRPGPFGPAELRKVRC